MRKQNDRNTRVLLCATGLVVARLTTAAHAAITIDGTLDATGYGAALATQTVNTQFGDNTDSSGGTAGGSELDAAYGVVSNGNLNLFFAGNLETNGNHLNIFIADGRPTGQSVINVAPPTGGGGNQLAGMNGTTFSAGFKPTFAVDINGANNPIEYVNTYDLTTATSSSAYVGSFTPGNGAANVLGNGIVASFNNSNVGGVDGTGPSPASATAADAVTTGFEISIPLSLLGSPRGSISVLADVNGGNNGYLSNQFLPGLPATTGNVGGGGSYTGTSAGSFNFSSTPNEYFVVPAATGGTAVNGTWNASNGGSWSTASKWAGGLVPQFAGDSATFGAAITAPSTVTLDGSKTVGQITFNNTNAYTIATGTGGVLTINDTGDTGGVNPLISVLSGSHVIAAPVAVTNGISVNAASMTALTVSGVVSGTGPFNASGSGTVTLAAANTFTGNVNILNGTVGFNNAAAASAAQILIGDPSTDAQQATLAIGTTGLTLANAVVVNHDGSGTSTARTIAGTYNSGNATLSGSVTLNGGVNLIAPAGTTLTISGVISNGQDAASVANHDVNIGQTGATTGTVVLSALNTYSTVDNGSGTLIYGDTFVNSGTLSIPAGAAIASGFVTVNTGATLLAAGALSPTASLYDYGTATLGSSNGTSQSITPLGAIIVGPAATLSIVPASNHAGRTLVTTSALNISGGTDAWTGKVDLGNNDLDVTAGVLSDITNQIKQGFNLSGGGNFSGLGITSSTAASDSRHLTALGVIANTDNGGNPIFTAAKKFDGTSPGPTDVLVKYTYFGDANLDGKVDGSDYSLIDAGYASNKPGFTGAVLSGWYNGDFNYDGIIDGSDYTLIDNAFNNQKLNLSTAALVATATAEVSASTVPEPASVAAIAVAGMTLLKRHRR